MRIGELAKRTNWDIETIRYYEKSGLLAVPARNSSGYREYETAHLERLQSSLRKIVRTEASANK